MLSALCEDFDAVVAVADRDLRVVACSDACLAVFEHRGVGRAEATVADIFGPALAAERMPIIRNVMATGTPAAVAGMVNGVWQRCTYRKITGLGPSNDEGLLVTSFNIHENDADRPADAPRVVQAERQELGPLGVLTEREAEVLRLIGLGYSTNDIAAELHRSVKTVQGHRNALGHKLHIRNRVELARIALRAGLTRIPTDDIAPIWRRSKQQHDGRF